MGHKSPFVAALRPAWLVAEGPVEQWAGVAREDWLERAEHIVYGWGVCRARREVEPPSAEMVASAYDLLAIWAAGERLEVHTGDEVDALLSELRQLVDSKGATLRRLAARFPNPAGWLDEADELEEMQLNLEIDELEAARWARELLTDLDDAELFLWALEREQTADTEDLRVGLERCGAWVAERAQVFLPAAYFAICYSCGVREDLLDVEPDLALTVAKFVNVLDAVRGARRMLATAGEPVGRPDHLVQLLRATAQRSQAFWRPPLPVNRPLLAAAASELGAGPRLLWRPEPPAEWYAFLRLPAPERAGDDAVVKVFVPRAPADARLLFCGIAVDLDFGGEVPVGELNMRQLRAHWEDTDRPTVVLCHGGQEELGFLDEG